MPSTCASAGPTKVTIYAVSCLILVLGYNIVVSEAGAGAININRRDMQPEPEEASLESPVEFMAKFTVAGMSGHEPLSSADDLLAQELVSELRRESRQLGRPG